MRKTGVALGILALSALFSTPVQAGEACRAGSGDPVAALDHHKATFAGHVVSVTDKDGARAVTFDLLRGWKGPKSGQVTVTTPADDRGYPFAVGGDYLVYAQGKKDALTTDVCSPNASLAHVAQATRMLDRIVGYQKPVEVKAPVAAVASAR